MTQTVGTLDAPESLPAEPAVVLRARVLSWDRLSLGALLVATGALYLWNVTINGMGNQFYAAAVQAGSTNWEALLFGSLDAHNFITVDKPPLSQWVMGLSGQLFGFSSASMLIPQALMAVAAVALLYGAVARISGPRAGLLAGAALALTPVAALMFRFNDPDAAMVLMMTAAAYCTVRAVQRGSLRWLIGAGVALGFAFLAKMLEGVMVMPALAAAYLVAAPVRLRVRLTHLLWAALAVTVAAGWFILLTVLWPASARPYLAGSTDNSFMNLVLGYNGLARVLGRNHSSFGSAAPTPDGSAVVDLGQGGFGGRSQGWSRLLFGEFGYEIGWLVPAALLAVVVVLALRGRAPRTDLVRAGTVVFGGWLLVDGLVLSYMHGTIHPYYTLSIAPPVAAMFAIGVQQTWACRQVPWCRAALVGILLAAGLCGWWLLGHTGSWPGLRRAVLLCTIVGSVALLWKWAPGRRSYAATALVLLALAGALAGPAAYAVTTVGVGHEGIGPSVGPARTTHGGAAFMLGLGRGVDNPALDAMLEATRTPWSAAVDRSNAAAALELSTDTSVMAIGGFSGSDPTPTLQQFQDDVANHRVAYYLAPRGSSHGSEPEKNDHGEVVPARAHADILRWVRGHFHSTTVGTVTAYDLSAPKVP
ncbi:MAG: glycosyltransferase family 39 protein [Mycobacterium sp.]